VTSSRPVDVCGVGPPASWLAVPGGQACRCWLADAPL